MRRVGLVLGVSVVMAAMMALTVGSALAKDSNSAQTTYTDHIVEGYEYHAVPPHLSATREGIGQFRATVAGDLPGKLDATIYYTGIPGPNVTSEITHGTWILCSEFTADPSTVTEPECTSDSAIQLTGTVRGGTARWDEFGYYVPGPLRTQVWIGIADVKATLVLRVEQWMACLWKRGPGSSKGSLTTFP